MDRSFQPHLQRCLDEISGHHQHLIKGIMVAVSAAEVLVEEVLVLSVLLLGEKNFPHILSDDKIAVKTSEMEGREEEVLVL